MGSREHLNAALTGFFECLSEPKSSFRRRKYEIILRDDEGRYTTTRTISVPHTQSWFEDPPREYSEVKKAVEELVKDDNVPLLQSKGSVAKAIENAVRELHIESQRSGSEEFPKSEYSLQRNLDSKRANAEVLCPIIGLTFDEDIDLSEDYRIRELSAFEKELMMNSRDLGGGSVTLRRAIQQDSLTHAAVFEKEKAIQEGWKQGASAISSVGDEANDYNEALQTALRILHSSRFQMGVTHRVETTFYPVVMSSHEDHGLGLDMFLTDNENVSTEEVEEYFNQVLSANDQEDEGLRVAINRLKSSYRKTSNADGVVDAIIGIEALLSPGRGGSFREVRRRAAVLSEEKAAYSDLGYLQNFRNSTVHGEEVRVKRSELREAQGILSTVLSRLISITTEKGCTRRELIRTLDENIEDIIQEHFEEAIAASDWDC